MSQQIINLGLIPNDGSGDALRVGAQKINENFTELYERGIPEQAGNNGKVLTTSGTVLRWDRVTDITGNAATVTNGVYTTESYNNPSWLTGLAPSKVLPNQSGNAGKYLTTDGATLSWVDLETVSVFDYNNLLNRPVFPDNTSDLVNDSGFITSSALTGYATETYVNSRGFITNNGLPSQSSNTGKYLTTDGTSLSWATIPTSFSSLVNGAYTLSLGSDGILTLPRGYIKNNTTDGFLRIEGPLFADMVSLGGGGYATIANGVEILTHGVGDDTERKFRFSWDGSLYMPTASNNSQVGAIEWRLDNGATAQVKSTSGGGLYNIPKGLQFLTYSGAATTISVEFDKHWIFRGDGSLQIPGDIKSNGNINIDINLADSTLRRWQFGEDGNLTFPDGTNYSGSTITLPQTTNGTANKVSWNFRDLMIGNSTTFLEWNLLSTDLSEFLIGTSSAATPFYFSFDGSGQTLGIITGGGIVGGGKLTFGSTAGNNAGDVNAIELKATDGDVYLTSTESVKIKVDASDSSARVWLFDPTGNLTFPDGTSQSTAWTGARTTVSASTASLANAATGNLTITGYKGYALYKIQTSAAAWVRIYTDTASRTADAGRDELTDPTPGSGVIAEVITTGAETVLISPGAMGFSNESTPSTNIELAVTNKSGGTTAITVTLTVVQLEA